MAPKVSVIIPVYNVENYLRQCLDSVINQTLDDIEIICVNDGSTDGSLDILREYEAKDSRVIVVTQKNINAGAARNSGLKIARGEYLSFLDSDDFFEPQMLERAYTLAVHKKADIVVYRCDFFYDDTEEFAPAEWTLKTHRFPDHMPFVAEDIQKNPFSAFVGWAWDKLFSAQFVKENNLRFQEQRTINDLLFVYSAVVRAKAIVVLNEILVHQRKNRGDALSQTKEKSWDCFYYALSALKKQLMDWHLFPRFKQDYINYALNFSLWHLNTLPHPQKKMLYNELKKSWFDEFQIIGHNSSYFYSEREFQELCKIIEMDFEQYICAEQIDSTLSGN